MSTSEIKSSPIEEKVVPIPKIKMFGNAHRRHHDFRE